MSYEFLIAKRYLQAKRRTGFISLITYLSIGGVFLGTAALIIALSMANGFENEVLSRIVGTFAHLKIQQYHNQPVTNYELLRKKIRKTPGVVASAPFITEKVGISSKQIQDGVLVMGINLKEEIKVTDIDKNLKTGKLSFDSVSSNNGNRYPAIVMGFGLADKLRLDIGDEVTLMSLQAGDEWVPGMLPRMAKFVLAGITECGMYEYDANICYVDLKQAQKLFDMDGAVTGIHIKVDNVFNADIIGQNIQDKLGYPYYSLDWKAQNRSLFSWMRIEKIVIFSVILLIVIIAAFNIVSSLIMIVMEKTKEIGILLSMGAKQKSIRRIFMLQGIFIGLTGTILGGIFGLSVCYIQHKYNIIPLPGDIYFINSVPIQTRFWDTVAVFASTNLLCFLATLYPSARAARLIPVKALRIG